MNSSQILRYNEINQVFLISTLNSRLYNSESTTIGVTEESCEKARHVDA